jgi:hypothetical protein
MTALRMTALRMTALRMTALRMVEVSGAEAPWPLEGGAPGRLVYAQRGRAVVRPARHLWEDGRPVVGPAGVVTDPHDTLLCLTLLRLHPNTVTGFRNTVTGFRGIRPESS